MRILHVHLSGEFAGSERYCADLAAGQAEAGHEVRVVVRDGAHAVRWRKECGEAGVVVIPRWVPGFAEIWVLRRVMRGFGPEVVHTHLGGANKKGGRAALKAGIAWVVTLHLRWKDKEMRGADGAICIAGWQVEEVRKGFEGLVGVIWNWLPGRVREVKRVDVERLRRAWECGAETMVFGSVGRLHGHKGMDVLVRGFRQAFANNEDVRLVIVGDGVRRAEVESFAAGDARIVMAGHVSEVEPYYAAFDAYVSAARYEPFGLTILEAMDAGKPLVCTRTGGPLEFLEGQKVRWAEVGDIEAMAWALRAEYEAGPRAVRHNMAPFGRSEAVARICDFYAAVMEGKGR